MKALTLTQPWATLVAIGAKKIETRSWSTSYRGPLAIHAAKTWNEDDFYGCFNTPFAQCLAAAGYDTQYKIAHLPVGCVLATCELVGMDQFGPWINERKPMLWSKGRNTFELTEQERAFGNYSLGRYGWFLANSKPLPEPIPARGFQRLWDWEPRP